MDERVCEEQVQRAAKLAARSIQVMCTTFAHHGPLLRFPAALCG
jgi:hypothetical protein